MKIRLPILMMICALGLSACACPRGATYQGGAYEQERMAGSAIEDNGCIKRAIF